MSTAPISIRPEPSRLTLPFQSGDMMDQPTFHELYKQAPENVRAELIGGIVYISPGLAGLWLDADALFRRDSRRVQEVLQQGIATPQHAEFVMRLRKT